MDLADACTLFCKFIFAPEMSWLCEVPCEVFRPYPGAITIPAIYLENNDKCVATRVTISGGVFHHVSRSRSNQNR